MRTLAGFLMLTILSGLVLVSGVTAGEKNQVHPSGKIIGMTVKNSQGETLGNIEDMVVNLKSGDVVYAVMARGEVLGLGGSFHAIAPGALTLSSDQKHLKLDATNKDFENAKGFDQNQWPTKANSKWDKDASNNGAKKKVGQSEKENKQEGKSVQSSMTLARVSAISGIQVQGRDKKSLGSIYDVAINCNEHQIVYAAVSHGSTLGVGGKLVAIPWDALHQKSPQLTPGSIEFYLDASQKDLETAEGFTSSDRWPSQPNAQFQGAKKKDS